MRVLITGVSGYVGSNIAVWLKQNTDFHIIGIYHSRLPKISLDQEVLCNLADYSQKCLLQNIDCDVVIHVAGSYKAESINDYINNNIKTTEMILDYTLKKCVKKFVYISTASVYGETSGKVSETSVGVNLSDYGLTKKICERMIEESAIESKLILRLTSTLGGYNNDYTRPWLPQIAYKMIHNKDIVYYNPGLKYNAVVYVRDVASYIYQFIIKKKIGCFDYILASCKPMTIYAVLNLLKKEINSKSNLIEQEAMEANRCYLIDISKAIREGFVASSVENVIKKFVKDLLIQKNQIDWG